MILKIGKEIRVTSATRAQFAKFEKRKRMNN